MTCASSLFSNEFLKLRWRCGLSGRSPGRPQRKHPQPPLPEVRMASQGGLSPGVPPPLPTALDVPSLGGQGCDCGENGPCPCSSEPHPHPCPPSQGTQENALARRSPDAPDRAALQLGACGPPEAAWAANAGGARRGSGRAVQGQAANAAGVWVAGYYSQHSVMTHPLCCACGGGFVMIACCEWSPTVPAVVRSDFCGGRAGVRVGGLPGSSLGTLASVGRPCAAKQRRARSTARRPLGVGRVARGLEAVVGD